YNIYYSPVAYDGWRTDEEAIKKVNCIYIDIDDLDTDISNMNADELLEYIAERSGLSEKPCCDYLVKSGKGCHLYFLVDTIEDEAYRKKLAESLSVTFQSDLACIPISHFIRLPKSNNVKRDIPVKSQLYKITDQADTSPERLEKYMRSSEEIDRYISEQREITRLKRLETLAKKKQLQANIEKPPVTQSVDELHNIQHENTEFHGVDNIEFEEREPLCDDIARYIEKCESQYTDTKNWRYRELLAVKDLLIYHSNRGFIPVGYRNKFCVCFASKAQNLMNQKNCVLFLMKLLPDYPESEIKTTVKSIYDKKKYMDKDKKKTIKNIHMAKILDFSTQDILLMNCCYSSNKKYQRQKSYYKKYGQYTESKKISRERFVEDNMDSMTNAAMAKELGCSVSTIKRIKNIIKNGGLIL
ncbi:MAG: hypothetical protein PUG83_07025, partial [Clostridiaceae bacterium]|nr:hypothetical protein [Clostridiaceae bacterium]